MVERRGEREEKKGKAAAKERGRREEKWGRMGVTRVFKNYTPRSLMSAAALGHQLCSPRPKIGMKGENDGGKEEKMRGLVREGF